MTDRPDDWDHKPEQKPEPAKKPAKKKGRRKRGGEGENVTGVMLDLVAKSDGSFWRGSDGLAYCSFTHEGAWQHHPVESQAARQWLRALYRRERGAAVSGTNIRDVMDTLAADATFARSSLDVFVRVGYRTDERAVYIDLCDERWQAVRCSSKGWEIVRPEVRFRRPAGSLPLPEPVRGGSVRELAELLNAGASNGELSDTEVLLTSWLVSAFRYKGPYPILVIGGEQGSAKSTTSQSIRQLIDPKVAPHRSLPRTVQDLAIAAENGWVLNFDNLSFVADEMSDALCRISTGSGFGTRALYSDRNETFFQACRPIILNGITELAGRPDLLERSFTVRLPAIPKSRRVRERAYWERFNEAAPRILGAVLDAVCDAVDLEDVVEIEELPRMADAAVWITASEPTLGWEMGTFLKIHEANQAAADAAIVEGSVVGTALMEWLRELGEPEWSGTASDLYEELCRHVGEEKAKKRHWPKRSSDMGKGLSRLAPSLRSMGVDIQVSKRNWDVGDRVIRGAHVWSISLIDRQLPPPELASGTDSQT